MYQDVQILLSGKQSCLMHICCHFIMKMFMTIIRLYRNVFMSLIELLECVSNSHLIIAICSRFIGLQECVHDSFDYSNVFMVHWVTGMCS